MQQFERDFQKERDASVDKNIQPISGRYYWKIKADNLDIIKASLDKLGAPKDIFLDIQICKRRGLIAVRRPLLLLRGKSHFIEIWHNENFKSEDKNTWMSDEWSWMEWQHDKRLKGFDDLRYRRGYKYMGVVKLTQEEIELYTSMNKYNL